MNVLKSGRRSVCPVCCRRIVRVICHLASNKCKCNLKTHTNKINHQTLKKNIQTRRSSRVKNQPNWFHKEYNF